MKMYKYRIIYYVNGFDDINKETVDGMVCADSYGEAQQKVIKYYTSDQKIEREAPVIKIGLRLIGNGAIVEKEEINEYFALKA